MMDVLKEVENSPFLFFGVLSWALIDWRRLAPTGKGRIHSVYCFQP